MSLIDNTRSWARRQLAPVTIGIMAALILGSLFFWFTRARGIETLAFDTNWFSHPWSIVTYPFAFLGLGGINALLGLLFLAAWMNFACTSVERTMGTPKYAVLWVTMTVVPALFYWLGAQLIHAPIVLAGPYMPVAAVSLIWARTNKTFTVNLYGILPISGLVLSWLIILGTLFGYGLGAPILGVFASLHLIPTFLFAENMIPFLPYEIRGYQKYKPSKAQKEKDAGYFEEVKKRQKEREEKERLRKLFENSLKDEDNNR